MRKLGGTDASFLYNETANAPQHVGGIQYLEVPNESKPEFAENLKNILLERVHLLPYLTSVIKPTPFDWDHPVWVRYPEFDIDEHFHTLTLDAPGSIDQLEAVAAELYEPLMDRSKPLWEMWVIDGLANGQVAVLSKTHHACIDGMASVAVQEILGDFEPEPKQVPAAPKDFWKREPVDYANLMREAWFNLAKYSVDQWARWPEQVATAARLWSRQVREAAERPVAARKAPWNAAITPKRGLAGAVFSLSALKAVGKATNTKINDVVLAITAEAVNRYLDGRGIKLESPLIAGCPVSVRKPGDKSMNNQVSMMSVSLENHVSDAFDRLTSIREASKAAKAMLAEASGAAATDFGAPFFPANMQALANATASGEFANQADQVPMNLVVSNVPGLRVPLYSAGAKVLGTTPLSIVTHGAGLNVTVTSYMDRVDLGLTAATNVVPDVQALRDEFVAAYENLVASVLEKAEDTSPQEESEFDPEDEKRAA